MKYLLVMIISIFLVGCGGGSSTGLEGVKADPTIKIETKDTQNTPPSVPEV